MTSEYLESLRGRGVRPAFYDPQGHRFGRPTYPFRWAPKGFLTRRQLRDKGLSSGGQDVQAQILWRHRKGIRIAYLYDEKKAVPKRVPTPAQLEAVQKALTVRKTCPECLQVRDYCIPISRGTCNECEFGASEPEPSGSWSWGTPDIEREAG